MNINQHRKLTQSLQAEADRIRQRLLEELSGELDLTEAQKAEIKWTGAVQVFGQSVWHLFHTPGSWDGLTYYRFSVTRSWELKSREPEDFVSPSPEPRDDGRGDYGLPGLDLQG